MDKNFKLARLNNAAAVDPAGLERLISTQTEIVAGVIETKYYELMGQALSDFIPFDVGRGAYSTNIFQYTSAYVGSPFESGLVQPSEGLGINAKADIQIDGLTIKNNFWRMDYEVSHEIIEMGKVNAQAFSIIEEKEKARKKVFDLGMQKVTFLGLPDEGVKGLLNQSAVTINTSIAAKNLAQMDTAELSAFAVGFLQAYLANNNSTTLPDRLCIGTSDYVALGVPVSNTYPTPLTKREVLERAFREAGATGLKIVHTTYNETASSTSGMRYALYKADPDSVRMYIPKPYTPHALYPMNGIDFVSVAEAQFSGVVAIRPLEMLYADVTAVSSS